MSLECSSCERDARAGHAPHCKFATVTDLRAEVARLTAELADAALDRAELSRIRPHRGDPYFYCTIKQRGDEVRQNVEHGQRIEALTAELAARTEERDGPAAAVDKARKTFDWVMNHVNLGHPDDFILLGVYRDLADPTAILAAVKARAKAEGLREAKARLHSVIKDYGVNPYCDNTSLVRMVEVWRLELLAEEIETMAEQAEGGKDA